jgi:hypothetical protein
MVDLGYETHGEYTNTFQSSDIFVQILYVCVDLVSGGNGSLEQVFGCLFLEICAVGNVDWAVVSMQRLIDVWVSKMIGFELSKVSHWTLRVASNRRHTLFINGRRSLAVHPLVSQSSKSAP